MSFDVIAKNLLSQNQNKLPTPSKADISSELDSAGFSRRELFTEYRNLYDTTEEDTTKRQILRDIAQFHGLTQTEEVKREVPNIIINVTGDNSRVAAMICPPVSEEAA